MTSDAQAGRRTVLVTGVGRREGIGFAITRRLLQDERARVSRGFGFGLGRGGAKRHRRVLRDNIQGVTRHAIRRLAQRAGLHSNGVLRLSGLTYEEVRGVLKNILEGLIRSAVTFCEHARHKTVTEGDVLRAAADVGLQVFGLDSAAAVLE